MAVNKVVYNTENGAQTLIDLTEDSVTPETLAEGVTAHDASGNIIRGTMPVTNVLYTEQTLTDEQKAQARLNIGAQAELTDADKADIAQKVIEMLGGNPVYGYVDENNNIIVQGNLADGTYSVKYEMEDGSHIEIGTLEVGENPEEEVVVNLIPTLTDTDLVTIYNGIGYKENTRISISAVSASNPTGEKTQSDTTLTGMIPVGEDGDVLHFRGIDTLGTSGAGSTYDGTFWCYNASGELITTQQTYIANVAPDAMGVDENGDFTITLNSSWLVSGTAYVRFNVGKVTGEFIMTRNQLVTV